MKYKPLIIIIAIFSMLMLGQAVYASDWENTEGEYIYCEMDIDTFKRFTENPGMEFLKTESKSLTTCSKSGDSYVKAVTVKDGVQSVSYCTASGYRINLNFAITAEFIDFFGHTESIKAILKENGIDCDVNCYVGISSFSDMIPVTIWAQTDTGNYVITAEYKTKYDDGAYAVYKAYTVYTDAEYYDAFRRKTGICIADGKEIEIEFKYKSIYFPFRKVAEALGSEVSWDQVHKMAYFTAPSGEYVLRTVEKMPRIIQAERAGFDSGYAGVFPYVGNINGQIFIGTDVLYDILELFDADLSVDWENLTVTIQPAG